MVTGGGKDSITFGAIRHLQIRWQTSRWSVHCPLEAGKSSGVGCHMSRHPGPFLSAHGDKRGGGSGSRNGAEEEAEICPPRHQPFLCSFGSRDTGGDGSRGWALLPRARQTHRCRHIRPSLPPAPSAAGVSRHPTWQCCRHPGHYAIVHL